jgi:hypothetical protein
MLITWQAFTDVERSGKGLPDFGLINFTCGHWLILAEAHPAI